MSGMYMSKREQIETAIALASHHHKGQVDKSGMPYILHPLTVMQYVEEFVSSSDEDLLMDARIVAILHDLLEDTVVTEVTLRYYCFEPQVIQAVVALTRSKEETYRDYIIRVSENPLATMVKLADLKHNLRPGCPDSLRARYMNAYAYLREQIDKRSSELEYVYSM